MKSVHQKQNNRYKTKQSLTLLSPCELAVARDLSVCIFSKTRLTFLFVVSSVSLLLQIRASRIGDLARLLIMKRFSKAVWAKSWEHSNSFWAQGRSGGISLLWCVTSQHSQLHHSWPLNSEPHAPKKKENIQAVQWNWCSLFSLDTVTVSCILVILTHTLCTCFIAFPCITLTVIASPTIYQDVNSIGRFTE